MHPTHAIDEPVDREEDRCAQREGYGHLPAPDGRLGHQLVGDGADQRAGAEPHDQTYCPVGESTLGKQIPEQ